MSIRKRFNEIFVLEDDGEAERSRFVLRVNQVIFHQIDTSQVNSVAYHELFDSICFRLGVNAHDFPQRQIPTSSGLGYVPAKITTLTRDDFHQTLLLLCILYSCEELLDEKRGWLSDQIEAVLFQCSGDIGIRWKEGFFYPTGAEELDKPLIEETLTWLKAYPNERKDYRRALECYLGGESLADVIKNCYLAIEGVTRKVLRNDKTLDSNKEQLLQKMNLSDGWKSILATYIKYAHDYRHASAQRHEIKKQEAEGYLYMTGLIIRLVIESKGDHR